MRKNYRFRITLLISLALLLPGCVSTVHIQVQRTPALNTAGIRRIAIMPFDSSRGYPYRETAQYIVSVATVNIQALNYFTLVNPSVITQLQRNNENIEAYVDALFNGQINWISSRDSSIDSEVKDREGNTQIITTHTREVEIEFSYFLTRARDGSIIGPVIKRDSISSSNNNFNELLSTTELLRTIVTRQLRNIDRDLVPHTVTETRTLARENSRDKELRARMKNAESLVKERSYRLALAAYLHIYGEYNNIAAALNASILHEALGETEAAANLMRAVYAETGNSRTQSELARLNRILIDRATIANQFNTSHSQMERVAAHADNEIQRVLTHNAKVWIYNNAQGNVIAEAVIDNLTARLINRGTELVDRDSAALIEIEQRFQLSGMVSDNDFVSIGNAAGANTIVIVGITGSGDMRRLQLRVLDIERAVTIMQSDTSEAWRL